MALQAIPAMDVMKDEAEVASREQDLTIAKTTLQFQELLIKNALTKNLDDPILEAMPVRPTDQSSWRGLQRARSNGRHDCAGAEATGWSSANRISIWRTDGISRDAARNALLPSLRLTAYYGGTGIGRLARTRIGYVASTVSDGFWRGGGECIQQYRARLLCGTFGEYSDS